MQESKLDQNNTSPLSKNRSIFLKIAFVLDVVLLIPASLALVVFGQFFVAYLLAGAANDLFVLAIVVSGSYMLYVLVLIPAVILTLVHKRVSYWSIPAFVFLVIFVVTLLSLLHPIGMLYALL